MNVTGIKAYFITNSSDCLRRISGYATGTSPNIWYRPNKNLAGFQVEGSHYTASALWEPSDTEACAVLGVGAACIAPGTRTVENKKFLYSLELLILLFQDKSTMNAGPHAVTSLSNTTGTLLPTTSQAVDYTAFNKASHIAQGNRDYFITYGPDRLRTKTSLQSGIGDDVLLTKQYAFGDFERETDANGTRQLHYIAAGDGLAAIYVKYDTGEDSLYYVMQDHLGSLVGAINSESDKVYRQSFDAWGRERNPQDWSYNNIPDNFPFLRGYTGHEHLKWFAV